MTVIAQTLIDGLMLGFPTERYKITAKVISCGLVGVLGIFGPLEAIGAAC